MFRNTPIPRRGERLFQYDGLLTLRFRMPEPPWGNESLSAKKNLTNKIKLYKLIQETLERAFSSLNAKPSRNEKGL